VDKHAGGAYVNCWINFPVEDGARELAKFYIEKEGWSVDTAEESEWVQSETYENNAEGLRYFTEAERDGASFLFNSWPTNGEDDEE